MYSRLAGYEDFNDAARLTADPTFRLIGSEKVWERGAALTSTLHWFETHLLAREAMEIPPLVGRQLPTDLGTEITLN